MNTAFKVTKYQLYYSYKGVMAFYAIIFLIASATAVLSIKASGKVTFGGLGAATVIFLFIAGLDWFKSSFKFTMANNVPRREFYYGTMAAFVILAAFMALVDTVLSGILSLIISYESLVVQLYGSSTYLAGLLWSFGLYTLFVCLGWFITMIYYRANKLMKIIITIIPFVTGILFGYIERQTGGVMSRAILDFIGRAMGFAYNNNTYMATFSFLAAAAVLLSFCFLLIRRVPVKD